MQYISSLPTQAWSKAAIRNLVILGSTGSIGCSALDVVRHSSGHKVLALAAGRNVNLLLQQALEFRPLYLAVQDAVSAISLQDLLAPYHDYSPVIIVGQSAYAHLASLQEADTILSAQVGAVGLRATMAAVAAGKVVCLANKESLVLAGKLIRKMCAETKAVILPVDSEHNAIFQAIYGRAPEHIDKIILTASGGPFRGYTLERMQNVKAEQALKHPNWTMGAKITIDSATLMNKGLEVLEAHYLYDMPSEQIEVLVHPQSIVHSLVQMQDGSSLAQLGTPDMRLPIAHCLNWPCCAKIGVPVLDLAKVKNLTFEKPDLQSFRCLELARRAMTEGGKQPIVLNAANEIAVKAYLNNKISFLDIANVIEKTMDVKRPELELETVEQILQLDVIVRQEVEKIVE